MASGSCPAARSFGRLLDNGPLRSPLFESRVLANGTARGPLEP